MLIRRSFGLFSGVYDILLGLATALLQYSSVGIPTGLSKFLPEVGAASGPDAIRRFLRHAVAIRLLVLGLLLVALNLWADTLAQRLTLGAHGVIYVRLLSGLVVARAVMGLMTAALNAVFAHVWSNLLMIAQAAIEIVLVGLVLLLGYQMVGVLGGLLVSAVIVAILAAVCVMRQLRRESSSSADAPLVAGTGVSGFLLEGEAKRFFRFSGFTYILGYAAVFVDMGFAAPALAVLLTPEQVALFATAFKLSLMTVGLVVAGFRGLYRPLFARLRIRSDPTQVRRAFTAVSKAQLVVLIPAGMGLVVLCGDYIPLLFGVEFLPAVPVARVLVGSMYAATAFNLPGIILSVDEQYRAIAWTQSVVLVAVPLFLIAATSMGLVGAAIVLGGARLASALWAYMLSRRAYEVRFPWAFAARVAGVSTLMAAVLMAGRTVWVTSVTEAVTLTIVGVVIYGAGLRVGRVLGLEEVELLKRTELPGHNVLVAWLAPGHESDRRPAHEGAPPS